MAKLYFTYAAMNAGKSTALLQSAFNYIERGMHVLLFTAAIDSRQGAGKISSRLGISEDAFVFDEMMSFTDKIKYEHQEHRVSCVFVDEAQFLTKAHVLELSGVADSGIPVMTYGLRTDFRGHLFEGSQWLLAIADVLREMKSICHCGSKATMNLRIGADGSAVYEGDKIEVGGNEKYVPLCRYHFFKKVDSKKI